MFSKIGKVQFMQFRQFSNWFHQSFTTITGKVGNFYKVLSIYMNQVFFFVVEIEDAVHEMKDCQFVKMQPMKRKIQQKS